MRLKSELYKKEQEEIVDKIIKILDLENNNIINLCVDIATIYMIMDF
jgi:hypothetical protein